MMKQFDCAKWISIALLSFVHLHVYSQTGPGGARTFFLENEKLKLSVLFEEGRLIGDRLELKGPSGATPVETDADFGLEIMYTDWSAPGKMNNADNPITLKKNNFELVSQSSGESQEGAKTLLLDFKSKETTVNLRITYMLGREAFYAKRNLAVIDTAFGHHFLRWFWTRDGKLSGVKEIVKEGGFGQPVAFLAEKGGAFFGVEYPAADNMIEKSSGGYSIKCGQEFGQKIGSDWLRSDWVVEGLTADPYVKFWFSQYLDDIRVAPLRPYSLYNTWYDLRSPEYPRWSPEKAMSEKSALGMVDILRKSMMEKYNIKLDAFVLDDGWDVYESDWALRTEQWPRGLKPLADELKKTNTALGVWFGPTGGYSFRMKRVNWMKEHGYEVVGKTRDNSMLCLAGKKYGDLFRKRVTDFTAEDGVGYYKWDGIQFSCSEPDHGHGVDIYSRRAVMESVIDKCSSVREKNSDMFLNITSGTWLSPWWVKYANTIWMQGMDYGFSDVPSISQRDGAITYRDFVLYDDFRQQNFWFPIANLMTHGIIKGKHESVGVETEPLDKFTDDVLLYFARGVSMYELYISPDILTEGEWTSISKSMAWARDRFPILMNSEMVGGNPLKGEAYAHVHFKGNKGIIAARNPVIERAGFDIKLDPALGLDSRASSLVLEKIYPTRQISGRLYGAGETVNLPMDGFETAVYELYPLEDAAFPLLAGPAFDVRSAVGREYSVGFHGGEGTAKILNPSMVKSATLNGKPVDPENLPAGLKDNGDIATGIELSGNPAEGAEIGVRLKIEESALGATIAVLLTPEASAVPKVKPSLAVTVNGNKTEVRTEPQEGRSQWYMFGVQRGKNDLSIRVEPGKEEKSWRGTASVWLIATQKHDVNELLLTLDREPKDRVLPPRTWNPGETRKNVKLGTSGIICGN